MKSLGSLTWLVTCVSTLSLNSYILEINIRNRYVVSLGSISYLAKVACDGVGDSIEPWMT